MERRTAQFGMAAVLMWGGIAFGQATLSFTAPATSKPPNVTVQAGNVTVIADTLRLTPRSEWGAAMSETLIVQGFTDEYGWLLQNDSVMLGNTAKYTVTEYSLSVTPAVTGGTVSEPTRFSLDFGNTTQPAGATLHWLQLLNEDKMYQTDEGGTTFGFPLSGRPGFWQVDNGDLANMGSDVAPYYDSNGGNPMFVPPTFFDNPTVGKATIGTYLHFYAIPAWDVLEGSQHKIFLADQGIQWGYVVVPEAGTSGMILFVAFAWTARRRR